jgi:hypothetical protein
MRRDAALIRWLLLHIETLAYPNQYISFHFEGYSRDEIVYHVEILSESGLIQAQGNRYSCFDEWSDVRLTWTGHELTALIRDLHIWEEALAALRPANACDMNFVMLQNYLLQQR